MSTNSMKSMLAEAFDQFRRYPLPPTGQGNKDLEDAHGSLILYDADVAGIITSIVQSPTPSERRIRELEKLRQNSELEAKFRRLVEMYPAADNAGKVARLYWERFSHIQNLLNVADRYVQRVTRGNTQ